MLSVYMKIGTQKTLLWRLVGQQGNAWKQGVAPFTPNATHQIIFEGVRGSSDLSDIALDDLYVSREDCLLQPPSAIPQRQVSVGCKFDGSFCTWQNDSANGNFNWSLAIGKNSGALRSDGYAFLDVTNKNPGDRARLVSAEIPAALPEGYCLTFYYFVWGSTVGSLQLSAMKSGEQRLTTLYSINGTRIDRWRQANVKITKASISNDFRLIFDGYVGKSRDSNKKN